MKKFFIFLVSTAVIAIVSINIYSKEVNAMPSPVGVISDAVKDIPMVTETKPIIKTQKNKPTVVKDVLKDDGCATIDIDKDNTVTYEGDKERNIKWVTAKAVIDSKGNVAVGFEGETYDIINSISFEYRLFTSDGKYVPLKNGYDNMTDMVGIGVDNKTCFRVNIWTDMPDSSVDIKDIDKVAGIEIHYIHLQFANDERYDEYTQTGHKKRFYNVERVP